MCVLNLPFHMLNTYHVMNLTMFLVLFQNLFRTLLLDPDPFLRGIQNLRQARNHLLGGAVVP